MKSSALLLSFILVLLLSSCRTTSMATVEESDFGVHHESVELVTHDTVMIREKIVRIVTPDTVRDSVILERCVMRYVSLSDTIHDTIQVAHTEFVTKEKKPSRVGFYLSFIAGILVSVLFYLFMNAINVRH